MAFEEIVQSITREASADLSASQYCFVTINGSGQIAVAAANSALTIGVLQNKPDAAGKAATVAVHGVSKVKVGTGGVAQGAEIATGAGGTVVAAAAGENVVGFALEAGAANTVVPVLIANRPASGVA